MTPGPRLIGKLYQAVDPRLLIAVDPLGVPLVPGAPLKGGSHRLLPHVAAEFRAIQEAGRAAGFTIRIASGYRTPEHQRRLFAKAVLKYGSASKAATWVAQFSEHSTGKTIDFDLGIPIGSAFVDKYPLSPAWKWLADRLPDRGWTNYVREPWHWTYNPIEPNVS